MATISSLLSEVLVEVPGCPNPLAVRALRRAARDFCRESGYWRQELSLLSLVDDTPSYSLDGVLPADSVLDGILSIHRVSDGQEIFSRSPLQLDSEQPTWRTERGEPEIYTQQIPGSIRLVPYPETTTEQLRILARLMPTQTAATIADTLLDHYAETLYAGAISLLLRIPDKPWSNASRSEDFWAQFRNGTFEARTEAERFFSRRRTGTVRYGGL